MAALGAWRAIERGEKIKRKDKSMGRLIPYCMAWCRRQRTLYTPLSVLGVAMLAVAAGPATCFVVPSSARLRGGGCFATASSTPKVVFGSDTLRGLRVSRDQRGGNLRQTVYAVIKRGGEEAGATAQGSRKRAHQQYHQGEPSPSSDQNAGFGVSLSLSPRKGTSAREKVLQASVHEVDLGSRVTRSTSDTKRILILMSDTGGGHRASSEALSAALRDLYGDQVRIYRDSVYFKDFLESRIIFSLTDHRLVFCHTRTTHVESTC